MNARWFSNKISKRNNLNKKKIFFLPNFLEETIYILQTIIATNKSFQLTSYCQIRIAWTLNSTNYRIRMSRPSFRNWTWLVHSHWVSTVEASGLFAALVCRWCNTRDYYLPATYPDDGTEVDGTHSALEAVVVLRSWSTVEAVWAVTQVFQLSGYQPGPHRVILLLSSSIVLILWPPMNGLPVQSSVLEAVPAVPWSKMSDKWVTHYSLASVRKYKYHIILL